MTIHQVALQWSPTSDKARLPSSWDSDTVLEKKLVSHFGVNRLSLFKMTTTVSSEVLSARSVQVTAKSAKDVEVSSIKESFKYNIPVFSSIMNMLSEI